MKTNENVLDEAMKDAKGPMNLQLELERVTAKWRATAAKLETMRDEQREARIPQLASVLADALEEAGRGTEAVVVRLITERIQFGHLIVRGSIAASWTEDEWNHAHKARQAYRRSRGNE